MAHVGKFSLVLNCGGYRYEEMIMCASTTNVIIDFDRNMELVELQKLMNFLDYTCGLFDRPMADWNKIVNTLKIFKEQFKLLDDKKWKALYTWLPQHKKCGGVLKLVLNDELKNINNGKEVFIKPQQKIIVGNDG